MEEFMISMDDAPGALASVTGAIAEAGANILAVSAIARQCATACIITDDADATRAALDGMGADYSTRVITRVMGLLTVTIAVQYFFDGLEGWYLVL